MAPVAEAVHHGRRGWGAAGKVIVFGIVKRNGEVKAIPIAAHSGAEVWREIALHTRPGSLYYTDDWQAYASLRLRGGHVVIRTERGRPKGRDTINGIEGFWSYAKNWLYPFRGVPRKYSHLYLGEACFRFNHRGRNLHSLLMRLMKRLSIGKSIPFWSGKLRNYLKFPFRSVQIVVFNATLWPATS